MSEIRHILWRERSTLISDAIGLLAMAAFVVTALYQLPSF